MFLRLVCSMFIGLLSSTCMAVTDNRLLYLDGIITGSTMAPLDSAMDKIINSPGKRELTIVINSPGGSVIAGMSFINKMQTVKALGVDINCYVQDVAASMAFQILTQCTHRYAMSTSFLLWHGVRVQGDGSITAASAKSLSEDLQRMDDLVLDQLSDSLDLSADTIRYHFDRETLWSGLGLHTADPKFITLQSAYPNLLPRLGDAVHTAPMSFFFGKLDGMVYIWSQYRKYVSLGVNQ